MADSNVANAQRYLNAMFGGHPKWVALEEDGITGINTLRGIIRAFQINNNLDVDGLIGPGTINKMKALPEIAKMDPDSEGIINVCLIQCALFCKGYNAGGITGIYYNSGESAVKQYQEDAGLNVTGIINWKVWLGLLSLYWFKLSLKGDPNIRKIQQQLNGDYSSYVGICSCDGVATRETILSLVAALQVEEGIVKDLIIDLNSVNFGDATTAGFPKEGLKQGNSEVYRAYNKIAQYGLYFNGYFPGNFDGNFDKEMKEKVIEFQNFYGLSGIGLVTEGEINVSTMKSLLISKGDTSRKALACDCATVLDRQKAQALYNAGYRYVGRYLSGNIPGARKFMTFEEIDAIKEVGLSVFPIYQDGGYYNDYFKSPYQGTRDAYVAIEAAKRLGFPSRTVIYFAVDYDCYDFQLEEYIVPYFKEINKVFRRLGVNRNDYRIGVYGPRYVCIRLSELHYTECSFVADMSTGFSCNLGYPLPKNWAFDQFYEESNPDGIFFPIDKDAFSGRDDGANTFDSVDERFSPDEIEQKNTDVSLETAKREYLYSLTSALHIKEFDLSAGIKYGIEETLFSIETRDVRITLKGKIENKLSTQPPEGAYTFNIDLDSDGNLTASTSNTIMEIANTANVDAENYGSIISNMLTDISLSLKTGKITFGEVDKSALFAKYVMIVESGDLMPDNPFYNDELFIEFSLEIRLVEKRGLHFEFELRPVPSVVLVGAVILVIYFAVTGNEVAAMLLLMCIILETDDDDDDDDDDDGEA